MSFSNDYAGWEALNARMTTAGHEARCHVHIKHKSGAMSVSVPAWAPTELHQLAEQIEAESDVTCQFCNAPGAVEIVRSDWIYKSCQACLKSRSLGPQSLAAF